MKDNAWWGNSVSMVCAGPYRKALAHDPEIKVVRAIEVMPAESRAILQCPGWPVDSEMAMISRE